MDRIRDQARPPDIILAGAGLRGHVQLTLETDAALKSVRTVFYSRFNANLRDYLRSLNPASELLDLEAGEYGIGMNRLEMYERMARRVVDAASAAPGVLVLQPGSAMVVDRVTQLVLDYSRRAGLTVRVLPGISCVEAVLAELGYDLIGGLQVILAQELFLREERLSSNFAALILQPGYYDTAWFLGTGRSSACRFDGLQRALGRTYPPAASMALVLAPLREGQSSSVFWFRLRNLTRVHRLISPLHSLFIPPLQRRRVNRRLARRIGSWGFSVAACERGADGQPVQEDLAYWLDANLADVPAVIRQESEEIARDWLDGQRALPMELSEPANEPSA